MFDLPSRALRALPLVLVAAPGPLAAQDTASPLEGYWIPLNDQVLADADGDPDTTGDQVRLNGNVEVSFDPVEVCSDIISTVGCGYTFQFATGVSTGAGLHLEADVEQDLFLDLPLSPPLPLPPFQVMIGSVPVVILPLAEFRLGIEGTIEAGAALDATVEENIPVGFIYDGGSFDWYQNIEAQPFFKAAAPELASATNGGLRIRPRVIVWFLIEIDGIPFPASPQFAFDASMGFTVSPLADPWWDVDAEIELLGSVGPSVTNPFWVPWSVLTGAGGPIVDAGGPLLNDGPPTDVRWTRAYDSSAGSPEGATVVLPTGTKAGGWRMGVTRNTTGYWFEVDAAGLPRDAFTLSPVSFAPVDGVTTPRGQLFIGTKDVIELDDQGTLLWHKQYTAGATTTNPEFEAVDEAEGGGYFVAGWARDLGERYGMLWRLDADGNLQWARRYLGPLGLIKSFQAVRATPDGGAILAGRATDAIGSGVALVKVGADGTMEWQRIAENSFGTAGATEVALAADGGYVVAGDLRRNVNHPELYNLFALKASATGDLAWAALYAEYEDGYAWRNVYDRVTALVPDGDGFVLAGTTGLSGADRDALLWRIGPTGHTTWFKSWQGVGADDLEDVILTDDGGLIAVGETDSFTVGGGTERHVWLAKTGSEGFVQWDPDLEGGAQRTPPRRATRWMLTDWRTPPELPADVDFTVTEKSSAQVPEVVTQTDLTRR